jgi:hypothetical protein
MPEEFKIDVQIDHNPLGLDQYAVDTFNLQYPDQELLIKWLDLVN